MTRFVAHAARALALATLFGAAHWACGGEAPSAGESQPNPASVTASTGGLEIVDPANPAQPWDFGLGVVPYGSSAAAHVKLRNTESRPLRVHDVKPGCSCTTPEISFVAANGERIVGEAHSDPVIVLPPGAIAELVLNVDTTIVPVQNTEKRVRVVITTDSPTNPFLSLEVHLAVELAFQSLPGTIRLGNVATSQGAHGVSKIVGLSDDGRKLTRVLDATPDLKTELAYDSGQTRDQWELSVALAPPIELGPFERTLHIGTTGPRGEGEGAPIAIKLLGMGVADVTIDPERFIFSTRAADSRAEVELDAQLAGARLMVREVRLDAADRRLRAEFQPVDADDRGRSAKWKLALIATAPIPDGAFGGKVTIVTDDSSFSEIAVPYLALGKR